ncbi:MAG TPA: neutral zinc metallopeptidase [Pyrinomonadaceae bacterium]|jgi:hypothetical protein|nr:neutral zinc metallopeptidase [Pyrinomonadaceae bacterium]
MPLDQLIKFIAADLDKYWRGVFAEAGWAYRPPKEIKVSDVQIDTACGKSEAGNAGYCPPSHSIYADYNLLYKYYKKFGDFTVLVILAHEWGHSIQSQVGITKVKYVGIQVELQADCFCGAYAKNADKAGYIEEGDLDEGVMGLFNLKDPEEIKWFDPRAHGRGFQRINSFLDGLKGGPYPCGFVGNLLGIWEAQVTEPGYPVKITTRFNDDATLDTWLTSSSGTVHSRSQWQYEKGILTQRDPVGYSSGTIKWHDGKHIELMVIQNQDGLSAQGRIRHYYRR